LGLVLVSAVSPGIGGGPFVRDSYVLLSLRKGARGFSVWQEDSIKRIPKKIRPLGFATQKLVVGKIKIWEVDFNKACLIWSRR
jgi:hypothetical protein